MSITISDMVSRYLGGPNGLVVEDKYPWRQGVNSEDWTADLALGVPSAYPTEIGYAIRFFCI
jgi:hypothetical protein